ncbi:hypothetical protein WJX84_004955, partial [Apatococcus fuscideae]
MTGRCLSHSNPVLARSSAAYGPSVTGLRCCPLGVSQRSHAAPAIPQLSRCSAVVRAAAAGVPVPSPAPASAAPQLTSEVLAPPQIFQKCLDIGVGKANSSALKIFLMAVLGGAFVSIGGFLALTVGMNCPGIASANPGLQKMIFGAFGFPLAVLLVVMTGAELFTGNTFFLPLAILEKKA